MDWLIFDYFFSTRVMSIITFIIIFINFLLAIGLIFLERRSAQSVWAWILVLFFLPIMGFVIYMLFGRTIYNQKIFTIQEDDKVGMEHLVEDQLDELKNNKLDFSNPVAEKNKKLIHMLLYNNQSFLTVNNSIETFTNGRDKFDSLLTDIRNAKDHIHFQYYIFRLDNLGKELYEALLQKQKEGVTVRILYDDMGSRGLSLRNFRKFKKEGGQVEAFFPNMLPLINPRMNNRNHRKIVVIDGDVGYVGGFNVGDEYLGLSKKFGFWRDTHLRISGEAVKSLQIRFMLDWNSHSGRNNLTREERYFPEIGYYGENPVQIASSGPDEKWQQIKYGYIKMIYNAKESIYIQTPYFIPDQSFLEAVKIAILSGIKVHLMIPNMPDHPFVYWGTYSNAGSLVKMGAEVHIYEKGFLHQKMVMIDDEVLSVGTTNIDNRSFLLNFEVNAFIYDAEQAGKYRETYEQDIKNSTLLTEEIYDSRSKWIRIKEGFANLISPIL
ncbi:cardiolipin synthase [Salinicoccus halodurans]|uniref:Cardiolipin synthase n=1 Tax=Salinicoccus halodurans TaxID=407035 RepID=A0A0F7HMS3_9STAP|nr:cardiolipin synthase [Salinicoccus halodurans]AKG74774.1 phospholipase D [Salinicoccus halodurans]SFK70479.1 cardiolipin synthetase 2 [Salinicoccus halodurans]